jgi:putative restriction endonuclease
VREVRRADGPHRLLLHVQGLRHQHRLQLSATRSPPCRVAATPRPLGVLVPDRHNRRVDRDEDVRTSCFSRLALLQAQHGNELPYAAVLSEGFPFRGRRVPFLNYQKGIYRAAVQRGPAALSIQTSAKSHYADVETTDGFFYDYRAGPIDQPDNRALRAAAHLGVPVVYFVANRPGLYQPLYPYFVTADFPNERRVLVTPGKLVGPLDEPRPVPVVDALEREYIVRGTKVRLHQGRFRGAVLLAYRDQCTICRLKEIRLLDAAHINPDTSPSGVPVVTNGLSMCMIHHRAFDQNLVGIRRTTRSESHNGCSTTRMARCLRC